MRAQRGPNHFTGHSAMSLREAAEQAAKSTIRRAIGLRKQKIGTWRQAAAPNPSYLGTTRSLNMQCGFAAREAEVAL